MYYKVTCIGLVLRFTKTPHCAPSVCSLLAARACDAHDMERSPGEAADVEVLADSDGQFSSRTAEKHNGTKMLLRKGFFQHPSYSNNRVNLNSLIYIPCKS